eukprot:gnl/Dysnectes_brevis/5327_a7611_388.p1 GENE.gnl/Dysnectes_brevis/5327_a7611_388~~gnl/Dysnectes_brevis/5327_a7611_388.p1  ORF type:complete len:506 (-),score=150.61 gnl/Dysnectes_brevis/5327_a7611_388:132-1649(-)
MALVDTITAVVPLILLLILGFICFLSKIFPPSAVPIFNTIVFKISIPASILLTFTAGGALDLRFILAFIAFFYITIFVVFIFLWITKSLNPVSLAHHVTLTTFLNTYVIGAPLVTGVFGAEAAQYAMTWVVAATVAAMPVLVVLYERVRRSQTAVQAITPSQDQSIEVKESKKARRSTDGASPPLALSPSRGTKTKPNALSAIASSHRSAYLLSSRSLVGTRPLQSPSAGAATAQGTPTAALAEASGHSFNPDSVPSLPPLYIPPPTKESPTPTRWRHIAQRTMEDLEAGQWSPQKRSPTGRFDSKATTGKDEKTGKIAPSAALHPSPKSPKTPKAPGPGIGGSGVFGIIIRSLLQPIIISVPLGLVWRSNGLTAPAWALSILQSLASLSTPLGLMGIGVFTGMQGVKKAFTREAWLGYFERCWLGALIGVCAAWLVGLEGMPARIAVMLASTPLGVGGFVMEATYKCRPGPAASSLILGSVLLIPSILLLLNVMDWVGLFPVEG